MPDISQASRPFRVTTALGADELILVGFTGHEEISRPFLYQLELISENHEINAADVLRKPATIAVVLHDGTERIVRGVVNRFAQIGAEKDRAFYAADVVPWFWFLSLSHDCRAFQNKNAVEIIEELFQSRHYEGYEGYDLAVDASSYPKREYCVQYNESDYDFVSRLMEEEGIIYFFRHTENKHVLVLADTNSNTEACPGAATVYVSQRPDPNGGTIARLTREEAVGAGKITLADFDPLQPSLTLRNTKGTGSEEIYHYQPVIYTDIEEGNRYARIRLEAEEAHRRVIHGSGTHRSFQAGCRINVEEHDRSDINGSYVITQVRHLARSGGYGSGDEASFEYKTQFAAIPFDIPYRAPPTTPKPTAHGAHTATVVGKKGEKIWTDEHGRVKIQFHWDRLGPKNENSSCWVRVATLWAGNVSGTQFTPRIGDEVLVGFEGGDIDRPIIVGSVYNGTHDPPFAAPDARMVSGIRSRAYSVIVFQDKQGEEQLHLFGVKDVAVKAQNDVWVVPDNDYRAVIGGDRDEEVKGDESIKVEGARADEVGSNETVRVRGSREDRVGGSEKRTVGASRSTSVNADDELKVGAHLGIDAQAISVEAGTKIALEANAGIELKVGASAIRITPAGIELEAPQIKLGGTAQIQLKAPIVMQQADAMLDMKGAVAQVNGDGMLTIRGAITMIN